jgi:hypothetical protein
MMSETRMPVVAPGAGKLRVPDSYRSESAVALAPPNISVFLHQVFSFPAMLGMLLVAIVFGTGSLFIVDPDCWWHVKVGEMILTTHQWPNSDPFSFTVAGQPWLSYEWGGDVLLALAERLGGVQGLEAFLIVVSGAVLITLYYLTTLCADNSKAGFVASTALLILAIPSFSLRPQMLGYVFLILTLIALERSRRGKHGTLWLLPVLFLVWINTHGSWIIGLGTIAAYWLCGLFEFQLGGLEARRWCQSDRKRISFVFLLSLCALPITPYGTKLCMYPFQVASSLPISVANILEWQPMPFNLPGGKYFLALLLAFILAQVVFRLSWRLETLALFLLGVAMAIMHMRFLLIFVPFSAPVLATVAGRWVPPYDRAKDKWVLNGIFMIGCLVAMVHFFPSRAQLESKIAEKFPVGAVAYLNHHSVPGPMYNSYGFGGYLVWSRGPQHKVFIDGRSELYEHGGLLSDYLHITDLKPGAIRVLHLYGVQSCLLDRHEPLVEVLNVLPDWQQLYADNLSVLFVRRADSNITVPSN